MIPGYPVNAEYANLSRFVEAAAPAAIGPPEIILARSPTVFMSLPECAVNLIFNRTALRFNALFRLCHNVILSVSEGSRFFVTDEILRSLCSLRMTKWSF